MAKSKTPAEWRPYPEHEWAFDLIRRVYTNHVTTIAIALACGVGGAFLTTGVKTRPRGVKCDLDDIGFERLVRAAVFVAESLEGEADGPVSGHQYRPGSHHCSRSSAAHAVQL